MRKRINEIKTRSTWILTPKYVQNVKLMSKKMAVVIRFPADAVYTCVGSVGMTSLSKVTLIFNPETVSAIFGAILKMNLVD